MKFNEEVYTWLPPKRIANERLVEDMKIDAQRSMLQLRSRGGTNINDALIDAIEKAGKVKTVMQITSIGLYLAHGAMFNDLVNLEFAKGLNQWFEFIEQAAHITLIIACLLTVYSGINYLVKYWNVFISNDS